MTDAADILHALTPIAASDKPLEEKLGAMLAALVALPSLSIEPRAAVFAREGDALHLLAHHRFQPALAQRCERIERGECLCGKVLETRRPVITAHLDDAHNVRTDDMTDHGHFNLPLRHAGRMLGVLTLYLGAGAMPDARERARIESAAAIFALVLALHDKERHLRIREREHRNALDLALDGILSLDERGRIRFANRAAHRILGWLPGELADRPLEALLPPSIRERHGELFAADIASGSPRFLGKGALVVEAQKKDGEIIKIEISASPLDRQTRRITAIFRDVTERENRNAQLARMRAALDAAGAPIFVCDREGRIVDCNPAFTELLGLDAPPLDKKAHELLAPDADEELVCNLLNRLNDGEHWQGELQLAAADGKPRTLLQTIAPVRDHAGVVRWHVSVLKDMTRAMIERERMEQIQRLESLGVLAGGIAHDFNNILAAIMGNASLALRKIGKEHDAARHLDRIQTASRSAADLCQQMMAYAGKGSETTRADSLNRIVRDMGELLQVSLHKSVALHLELDDALPPAMLARGQIRQVVMNLITNANEAIGKDQTGQITLRTGAATLASAREGFAGGDALKAGRYVTLCVEDTGCGMDEATLARIFEPFYTTKFSGRGLGLSAILGIVRKHGGALRVESEPGRGSRFEVWLPACDETAAETPARAAAQGAASGKCVLIVDDEAFIREIVGEILREAGIRTLSAESGEQALAIHREHGRDIDLILLDVTMPGMDGFACMREILKRDPGARIALCSGYSANDIDAHVGPGMAAASIAKPFDPQALRERVESLLTAEGAGG